MGRFRANLIFRFRGFYALLLFVLLLTGCGNNAYKVGGTVTGLSGSNAQPNLVLQNNGTDDLTVSSDGSFNFPTVVLEGNRYNVTVLTQPIDRICTIANGSGAVPGSDVHNVTVNCDVNTNNTSKQYNIGGNVNGLLGTGLVLQNNGGDDLTVTSDGGFNFATSLADGSSYDVTVLTQPTNPEQVCTVSNSGGTVAGANVANVSVSCSTTTPAIVKYFIGGTVAGLSGTGLVLQNNASDDIAISASGGFSFATPLANGSAHNVTVLKQPTAPNQTCTVSNAGGTVDNANVTDVKVNCVTNSYILGGTVSGLSGTGLVLQNGADKLNITSNGNFNFTSVIKDGSSYKIIVAAQPSDPSQNCTVTGGAGSFMGADVSNVKVDCTTNKFSIGGTISGLTSSGLVLLNNSGDSLTVAANSTSFTFPSSLIDDSSYQVTIKTQPAGLTCTIANSQGTLNGSNVTNIAITCAASTFYVTGTVTGLTSGKLVLQNNGGDTLSIGSTIAGISSFQFAQPIANGSQYNVIVLAQPTSTIACSVSNGTGTIAGQNANVTIRCANAPYTIGVSVNALKGSGLVLQNIPADKLTIPADGTYTFSQSLADNAGYDVSVATQPTSPNQTCTVSNGSGTIQGANITSISVSCVTTTFTINGNVTGLAGTGLVLQNNGNYNVNINANGSFNLITADGSTYDVKVLTQPTNPAQICTVANGSGTVVGTNINNVAVSCVTQSFNISGTVTGLTANDLVLQNNGADDLAVKSSDSNFTLATLLADGSSYHVAVGTQPTGEVCWISNGTGNITGANVTNVSVDCGNTYDHTKITTETCSSCHNGRSASGKTQTHIVTKLECNICHTIPPAHWLPGPAAWAMAGNQQATITFVGTGASFNLYRTSEQGFDPNNYTAYADAAMFANVTSPFVDTKLQNGKIYYYVVEALSSDGYNSYSNELSARPDILVANNTVNAIAAGSDGTIYLGGDFTQMGPRTGHGVPVNAANGSLTTNFPVVYGGVVQSVVADGGGGWYIGGSFTKVGDYQLNGLAHLLADGTVDQAWDPNPDQAVNTMILNGTTLYVGGGFTSVGANSRNYAAAFDTTDGSLLSWNPPIAGTNATVNALIASSNAVYLGGHFTVNVGAQSYDNLVAVDSINGNPFIWNLTADGDVYALSINGSTVYAGGYFTTLGSITRNGLAAIDDNTGSILSWDPNVIKTGDKATIYALALSGNTLFAGGNFTNVGGMNHNDLVAIDISGNPLDWNIDTNDSVYALTTKGNIVYAGGRFTNIGGIGYRNIAVLDGTAHMILSWSNNVNQEVRTLAVGGDQIYIGGYFNSLGGIVRNHLAALDGNGNLRSWAPAVTGRTVDSLAIIDNNVYVGGDFTTVNGQGYNNLTAIDTTGNPLSWNPDVNNSVNTLAVSGNVLYLGGSFTAIGSTPVTRNYLAAFDTGNGSLLPWDPSANGTVNALAVTSTAGGDTIYAGGNFTQVAGQNRNYLARILPDGSLDPAWDPNANGTVAALAVQSLPSGDTVYVGGDFSGFGNNPTVMQNFLACIQPTGIVDPNWNPAANGAVTALAISSNTLYTAGAFTGFGSSTNTQPRNYLAAIDTTNGNLLPWNPITSSNLPSIAPWITSIKISGGKVYAGGVNFSTIDGDFTGFTTLLP